MIFLEEAIISGFLGEVISRCTDISWTKIKEAVKNRKNEHQNIESQIYNVIVNVLNQIIYNKFENDQDKIYQAAEKILVGYKNAKGDSIEAVRSGLQIFSESINTDKYMEFKTLLYQELCKKDFEELYRQIRLLQQDEESGKTSRIEQKVDNIEDGIKAVNEKLDSIKRNNESTSIVHNGIIFQNNKKKDYIKNWNSRLFLHIDNDEKPITLADAFIVPKFNYYIKGGNIKFSDKDSLTEAIEKFIQYDKTSNLLITGSPGIGKTSIISWIANKYKDDEDIIILRFRDWSNKNLAEGLFNAICNSLDCESIDLENKVLIIDGFDEIKSVNERKSLIRDFFNNSLDFDNLKVIVTSRPDYLDIYDFKNAFEVLPFDIFQIKEFYQVIIGGELDQGKIDCDNLDILGIPVILYMAIMSDIKLTLKSTRPELYNQIFAEKGGIFDRFCFKGIGYNGGFQPLRDEKNIKIYLDFLQQAAFSMFEKNDLVLIEKEYDIPELMFQGDKLKVVEFPIKPFFESDGGNIEFIHKSIYEYFVAEYIFTSIYNNINIDKEGLAYILGCLFKKGQLTKEILEFLKYRVRNESNNIFCIVYEVFQLMVQDGMTYYITKSCKNVIDCEMKIFTNMFEILHLWDDLCLKFDDSIRIYLKCKGDFPLKLNLQKVDLSGAKLGKVNLEGVNLRNAKLGGTYLAGANLKGADLRGADLKNAYLAQANLKGAYLVYADLKGVNLDGAEVQGAWFDEGQVPYLDKRCSLFGVNIYREN